MMAIGSDTRIIFLEDTLLSLVYAIEESGEGGCTDHLGCREESDELWYELLDRAKKLFGELYDPKRKLR